MIDNTTRSFDDISDYCDRLKKHGGDFILLQVLAFFLPRHLLSR